MCMVILVLCLSRLIILLWLVIFKVILGYVCWNLLIKGVSWCKINGFVVFIWSLLEGECFNSCSVFLFFFKVFRLLWVYWRNNWFFLVNFSFWVVWFNRVIFNVFFNLDIVWLIFVICCLSKFVVLEKLLVFIIVINVFKFFDFVDIGILWIFFFYFL